MDPHNYEADSDWLETMKEECRDMSNYLDGHGEGDPDSLEENPEAILEKIEGVKAKLAEVEELEASTPSFQVWIPGKGERKIYAETPCGALFQLMRGNDFPGTTDSSEDSWSCRQELVFEAYVSQEGSPQVHKIEVCLTVLEHK